MGANISPLAQEDVRQALDRALETPNGIAITFDTANAAANKAACITTRARIHKVRAFDREQNRKLWPVDHPMHGNSVWDAIFSTVEEKEDGSWLLELRKTDASRFKIKEL